MTLSLDIIINIGKYRGSITQTLLMHQLKAFSLSNYKHFRVIYIIAENKASTTSHETLLNYIKNVAKNFNVNTIIIFNTDDKGLAHGRNIGLLLSNSDIIAYIDDDAIPSPDWVKRLATIFENDDSLAGVFGSIEPLFIDPHNICKRMTRDLYWLFSCSSNYMPRTRRIFYRGFGANMAFRRKILYKIGGFKVGLGVDSNKRKWMGGEEVELALRLCNKGYKVVYDPQIVVYHIVPSNRCSLSYALRRAYSVGKINRLIMHIYRKYMRKECKSSSTYEIMSNVFRKTLRDILSSIWNPEEINRQLFKITVAFSFLIGMMNLESNTYEELF